MSKLPKGEKKLINEEEFIKNANKINKPRIEKVEYIDVNSVSDNQDVYNYLMDKLNEIIDVLNKEEK